MDKMKETENKILRIKELSKILRKCTDKSQEYPCENCIHGKDGKVVLVCRGLIDDFLEEIDRL